MAIQHPLLEAPKTSSSHCKPLYLILCLAAIISSTTLVSFHVMNKITSSSNPALTHFCDQARDQESCLSILSEIPHDKTKPMSGADLLQALLQKSTPIFQKALEFAKLAYSRINDPKHQAGIADCVELMDLSIDRVINSVTALQSLSEDNYSLDDVHTWLSAVLTNHVICLDGLKGPARTMMEPMLNDLMSRSRAFLALVVAISDTSKPKPIDEPLNGNFPSWVTSMDIRLFQDADLPKEIKANAVVAQDGSGRYSHIKDAVAAAPSNSETRYIIYVKKGTYKENVEIGVDKTNLMIVGDGMDYTIITGSLSNHSGYSIMKSATLAAIGNGFIAQGIRFQNTAGPENEQAVALRVTGDKSVINKCRIEGYQDSLFTHSNRQFYRDSYIAGTVDFIFGDAAVVFQYCTIVARRPLGGQSNVITAQGRADPTQNSGTSIQRCHIVADDDLKPVKRTVRSYLGRPWQAYSRTVVMQSKIGNLIDRAGWLPMNGGTELETLYYGEYANEGPGAGTSLRVNWSGYHIINHPKEALPFTVANLIQGGPWLKSSGVAYIEGL